MRYRPPGTGRRRPGKTLVLFALLLPVLLGMIGLVIDTGLLLASYRQAQNAADAAALAALIDNLAGKSDAEALATAQAFVQQYNGLSGATLTLNLPPTQGPYAGNSQYAEAIVTSSTGTWFIQVLGASSLQTVSAGAVAGLESVPAPETLLLLDPNASPGLAVTGGMLQVNGRVAVNAQGAGYDQNGTWLDLGSPSYAVTTGTSGGLAAGDVRVVGGVDTPGNFQAISSGGSPLHAGTLLRSDPLLYLPAPTTANGVQQVYPGVNGQTFASPQNVSVSVGNGDTITFSPGVYSSITVSGNGSGTVTFNPGIYVLLGGQTPALSINTAASVTGNGVLFYNTGSDYDVTTGLPDSGDGNSLGSDAATGVTFGGISIQAGQLNLSPLQDASSPFNGLLVYQRRWNTQALSLQGSSSQDQVAGTLYARWAPVSLQGPGTYRGQFVVGNLSVSVPSPASGLSLNYGPLLGAAPRVFLVE